MMRIMCKSKIHRARITKTAVHYEGSIGIDALLMQAADILPHEVVQVVNIETGARFETYAIEEPARSGTIALYGGAARLGKVGELLIIMSSVIIPDKEARRLKKHDVLVDQKNHIKRNP